MTLPTGLTDYVDKDNKQNTPRCVQMQWSYETSQTEPNKAWGLFKKNL
jgi:hypothetical protein